MGKVGRIISLLLYISHLLLMGHANETQVRELLFSPGGQDFYKLFLRPASPVVIRSAAKSWPAVMNWQNETYVRTELANEILNVKFETNDSESPYELKQVKFEDLIPSTNQENWSLTQNLHNESRFLRDLYLPLVLQCKELLPKITDVVLRMHSMAESSKISTTDEDTLIISVMGDKIVTIVKSIDGTLVREKLNQVQGKSVVHLNAGDIFFLPRFYSYMIDESSGHLSAQIDIKLNVFDYNELVDRSTDEAQLNYYKFLDSQPKTIDCPFSRNSMRQNLDIDWEQYSEDDDSMFMHLRIPRKSKGVPEDVILASGYSMPVLGLGTAFLNESTYEAVKFALETGYRLFDTAYAYPDSEVLIGKAIKASSVPREKIFIVTKLHPRFLGYEQTLSAIDESLERLGVEYIDAYLIHSIECDDFLLTCGEGEPHGTWQDSWRAMEKAHNDGKIRSLGFSNLDTQEMFDELIALKTVPVSIVQNWFDPLHQDLEIRKLCAQHGVRYMGYSTFGDRWKLLGLSENPVMTSSTIHACSGHYDYVVQHVILKWAIVMNVTVIPRSANPIHIAQNYRSLEIDLYKDDVRAITRLGDFMEEMQDIMEDEMERFDSNEEDGESPEGEDGQEGEESSKTDTDGAEESSLISSDKNEGDPIETDNDRKILESLESIDSPTIANGKPIKFPGSEDSLEDDQINKNIKDPILEESSN